MIKHQQSDALELYKRFHDTRLKAIADYGCCAFVALWIMGIEGGVGNICLLADEIGKGLDADCTVYWAQFFKNICGREIAVEFKTIKSITELNGYGRVAVRFDYNEKSHWVGVENGVLAYNSLAHSVCVEKGKPTQARIIRNEDGDIFKWN